MALSARIQSMKSAKEFPISVFFTGSTDLVKGQGLCYDRDHGTAANVDGRRDTHVELPSASNFRWFAGVTARSYAAKTGGQIVEIYGPGSVCQIALAQDSTIGTGVMGCIAGSGAPGRFGHKGFYGLGAAIPLQTIAAVLASDLTGGSALDSDGLVITDGNAPDLSDVAAGDYCWVMGVEDDDTNSGTPAIYTVSSVDDDNDQITLSSEASDGGTMQVSYVIFRKNPKALAYLIPGTGGGESGMIEYVMPPDVGHATAGTFTIMQGGVTYLLGGYTQGTANGRAALSDGAFFGQKKGVYCLGAVGTNDVEVEPATAGLQMDGSTALVDVTFDAADEVATLAWWGIWMEICRSGAGVDAS